ncbi:uncharacterized protein LOC127868886 isoform X3 [Dreissena polymorpha]|uniref:uncharacterized protein LOC127868886 isoform X3 n=1 Tax=Dreissena polymorpha TaxID=45954 RepID=UPI002264A7E0|nr:uncharacterized protein LOC127868886 isoform X3 [Dreissena polymorpha]XP_052266988.1 uncharacterized protein LOC127868886 isoform X3 [Dreissena polymorpha]
MNSRMALKILQLERGLLKSCVIMCVAANVLADRRLLDRVDALRSCLFHPDVWQHGHRVALDGGASGAAAKSQVVWNPIIYVGTNKKFRMAFYQSLPCTRLRYWFEVREEEIVSEDTKPDDTPGQSALRASQQSASTVIPPATNKVDTTIVCTTDV